MVPKFLTMMPRAVAIAVAALVLTSGAMGASAAVGGPNLPDAVLTALGVGVAEHESGIGQSQASETGLDNANERASLGGNGGPDFSDCAELTGRERGECVSGIARGDGNADSTEIEDAEVEA